MAGDIADAVGSSVKLRPAARDDAAAIAAIYAPHVLAGTASFELAAPDADAMAQRMAASGGLYPWLVATDPDGVVGYAYASTFNARAAYRWTVETTIYVADRGRRRGVGRHLCTALLATLRTQGFRQAVGTIALPNEGSIALHEALGFVAAGVYQAVGWKHERWIDVGVWQCPFAASSDPPAELRRFADVGLIEN